MIVMATMPHACMKPLLRIDGLSAVNESFQPGCQWLNLRAQAIDSELIASLMQRGNTISTYMLM